MSDSTSLEKPILIYDKECQLCLRFKQALDFLDRDKKIQKIPLQEDWLYEKFPTLFREECEDIIHLVDESGEVLRGAEVIEYLVGFFPGVKKFSWLVASDSGKKAANLFYDKVNEIRKKAKSNCKGCGRKS